MPQPFHLQNPANPLRELFGNAARAMGYDASYNDDGGVRHVMPRRAADLKRLNIRELQAPKFVNSALNHVYLPTGEQSGKRSTMETAILAGSRCAMAGTNLLIVDDAPEPIQAHDDMVVYPRQNMQFHTISPGLFAVVPDKDAAAAPPQSGEVANSSLSDFLSTASVDLETMPLLGFRVSLSRADRRQYMDGLVTDAALMAIALGLARAADATLLTSLKASTLSAFSMAKAAAASLAFDELTGITNGSAAGLTVGYDGKLRAAGVLSELSADANATIVGSFARSAVAVHQDITLLADRTSVEGDLVLTCWANMQALVPNPGYFWTVA